MQSDNRHGIDFKENCATTKIGEKLCGRILLLKLPIHFVPSKKK